MSRHLILLSVSACIGFAASCAAPPPPAGAPTPVYNKVTRQLEQLVSDRNGDRQARYVGDHERHAHHEDLHRPQRRRPARSVGCSAWRGRRPTIIERAEEANGADGRTVTRHEHYERGVLATVDDDTDGDGRADKWETYDAGRLSRVDFGFSGRGTPTRRSDLRCRRIGLARRGRS